MANVNVTSNAWTEISITSGTVQNISATADIELSAEQTDNSGVVLKPSEIYQWDNETIYARAVTEETGALRVVNFKKAAGGGGYVLPVASASTLGGVKVGNNLSIDANGVLSAPVNYSTTEQQIGTWIDGKPIYQITIQDTMPTVTTDGTRVYKDIDVSSLNMLMCVGLTGIVFNTSDDGTIPLTAYSNTANNGMYTFFSVRNYQGTYPNSIFIASTRQDFSNQPCYITLQYTKTTD